jgi:hypothetical protein
VWETKFHTHTKPAFVVKFSKLHAWRGTEY